MAIYMNVSYANSTSDTLWKTTNDGQTWTKISGLFSGKNYSTVKMINQRIYIQADKKIYVSNAEATNWEEISTPISGVFFVEGSLIMLYPNSSNGKNYRSTDHGKTWQQSNAIWQSGVSGHAFVNKKLYVTSGYNIYVSADSGMVWKPTFAGDSYINDIIAHKGVLLLEDYSNGIYRSDDEGKTIKKSNFGYWDSDPTELSLYKNKLYAFNSDYQDGIYAYSTQTEVWDSTNIFPFNDNIQGIFEHNNYLFATTSININKYPLVEKLFRSKDKGMTWDSLMSFELLSSYTPHLSTNRFTTIDSTLFFKGEYELLKSNNNGNNWETLEIKVGNDFQKPTALVSQHGKLLASTYEGVIRSNDLGVTWEKLNIALPVNDPSSYLFSSNNTLLFVAAAGANRRVFFSEDDGDTWINVSATFPKYFWQTPVKDKPFGNFISINDAWLINTYISSPTAPNGIFLSIDKGLHWTIINDNLGKGRIYDMELDKQFLYATSSEQSVWKRPISELNATKITGKVYKDQNDNGIQDGNEPDFPFIPVQIQGKSYTQSDNNGNFALYHHFFNNATDTLTVIPPLKYVNIHPPYYTVNAADSLKTFGIYFKENIYDVCVAHTNMNVLRPGYDTKYVITYKNVGTTQPEGTIKFVKPTWLTFLNSSPTPNNIEGDTLTWTYSALNWLESRSIEINVNVPATTPLGTKVTTTTTIQLKAGKDVFPQNNLSKETNKVFGSFDPNDKEVSPKIYDTKAFEAKTPLTYTIRFQNTGNYPAERVRILDSLDARLDVGTIQVLNASHPYSYSLRGNGIVEFAFNNIHLPDSANNPLASHGFVQFSVLPKPTFQLGESISNKAYIYFDYNAPILTNTVKSKLAFPVATQIPDKSLLSFPIFPNPNNGFFQIDLSASDETAATTLSIYQPDGKIVQQQTVQLGQKNTIDASRLTAGIYWLSVVTKKGIWRGKVVKE
jgi:uncharacterized repeat protein (TIGR01451 family)